MHPHREAGALERAAHLGDAHPQRHRQPHHRAGAHGEVLGGNHADAGHGDGGEHGDGGPADDRLGDGGEQGGQLGHQPRQQQDQGGEGEHRLVDHLVHGDDAHVLAVGGGGQAAEQGTQDGHRALGHDAAGQLPISGHTVHAAHGGGGQVADGLHRVDDVHHRQGNARADLELHAEVEGGRQLEPARRGHGGEVHHAQAQGHDVAHDHAPEDGPQLQHALAEVLEEHHHRQGDQGHRPVLQAAEPRAARAAGHVLHRRGVEGQADGENDGPRHQRGEEPADGLDKNAEHDGHHTADQFRPQNSGQAKLPADGGEGGDIGEADAHNYRQT